MSRLVDFRQAIVDSLAATPGVFTCEPYAGQFGSDEIDRKSFRAPALFVAVAGSETAEDPQTGELYLPLDVVVFVVAHQARRGKRHDVAADLAEATAITVHRNRWGYAHCDRAGLPRLDNRYAAELDKKGLGLWVVRWPQTIALGEDAFDDTGVAPTEIYLGVAPDVGAGHEDDYRKVAGGDHA